MKTKVENYIMTNDKLLSLNSYNSNIKELAVWMVEQKKYKLNKKENNEEVSDSKNCMEKFCR